MGTATLTTPQGRLDAVGFTGNLNLGTTLSFSCDSWSRERSGSSIRKALVFQNNVEPSFSTQFEVTCAYTVSTPPSFTPPLEPVALTANEPKLWQLPNVAVGSFSLATIKFEPDAALAEFLTFFETTRSVAFNGDAKSLNLASRELTVRYTLVDSIGIEVPNTQAVIISGCQTTKAEIESLQTTLSKAPLKL